MNTDIRYKIYIYLRVTICEVYVLKKINNQKVLYVFILLIEIRLWTVICNRTLKIKSGVLIWSRNNCWNFGIKQDCTQIKYNIGMCCKKSVNVKSTWRSLLQSYLTFKTTVVRRFYLSISVLTIIKYLMRNTQPQSANKGQPT